MSVTDTGHRRIRRIANDDTSGVCSDCRLQIQAGDVYYVYGYAHVYPAGPLPRPHHRNCERPSGENGRRVDLTAVQSEQARQALVADYRNARQYGWPWTVERIRQRAESDPELARRIAEIDA